ncbi:MAG: multiprotein bridging factor aMBF1 [Candidatus Verstraetearchaeota archaeon]|nr:multiprotein bridging factor aMBF1 [Candidatus Verstraetearchaeota archaeon]
MNCEICGRKINNPIRIEIDKSILNVCRDCSKFGTIVTERKISKPKQISKPITTNLKKEIDTEEEIVENFGEIIRKRREELNITREELAKKLGEKESVIRRIENCEIYPPHDLLVKIEKLLKISLRRKIEKITEVNIPNINLTLGDIAIVKEGKKKNSGPSRT